MVEKSERAILVRRLEALERPRAAAGRESAWIDGTWHSARRGASSTACGRDARLANDLAHIRIAVCLTCEANDRHVEPTMGL